MFGPAKLAIKNVIRPLIYRYPPIMIRPERLLLWKQTVIDTADVPGEVIEVGCYLGGTSAVTAKMMANLGIKKKYSAYDTFSGFVENQVKTDNAASVQHHFSANSPKLTRWVLNRHGGENVAIIQGDIASLPDTDLPDALSACLLDVDLSEPIYLGLKRILPRLSAGGIILVDDCEDGGWYKARVGYEQYMLELGQPPLYKYGMGILKKSN
ncbi:class I SAM-dependent methyltransferase [Bradyrhizobium sp. 76]|uniref:class I SAM-dependent methyltransferase n=1 Tax=Bradyrhizobium sp. 76 TaxID=2782680 RepID=UPI001FFA681F|nr:class I SAM-dependent methyltransferase [Bradyrhizobium sp. 76]